MRRTKAMIMVMLTCITMTNNLVYASDSIKISENEVTSFDEAKEEKYTNKKIEDEKKNKTNVIDNNTERYLNNCGMFDEEIENLDKQTIEELEDCNNKNIEVYTTFFEYIEPEVSTQNFEDAEKNDDNNIIEKGTVNELTNEEINELIAEQYYDVDISEEKEDSTILDNVLEAIGLKPVDVYAGIDNYRDNVNDMKKNTTYLKRTILIMPTKLNNKQYYKVLASYTWINMPANRLVDLPYLSWGNGLVYDNTSEAFHNTKVQMRTVYTKTVSKQLTGEVISEKTIGPIIEDFSGKYYNEYNTEVTQQIPAGKFAISGHKLFVVADLMDDDLVSDESNNTNIRTSVDHIAIHMWTYLKRENNFETSLLETYYFHTKAKQKVKINGVKIKFKSKLLTIAGFMFGNINCVTEKIIPVLEDTNCELVYRFK